MTTAYSHLIGKHDAPDERDFQFIPALASPPRQADLRRFCPPVYDQLTIKSCSAHAVSAALRTIATSAGAPIEPPSRLFLYYNSRLREDDEQHDNGATIRNAIKAAAKPGVCPESLWPYDPANVTTQPPQSAYTGVTTHAASYFSIPRTLHGLKSCIAEGYPFVFGVQIYDSAVQGLQSTGRLNLPAPNATLMGGHAVLAVAYDDDAKVMTALNSCGPNVGAAGYLVIPYAYFEDDKLTYDFWTIRKTG